MTKWAASLIRISNHEVETLQKRLAEITERRVAAELRIAMLDAEAELEAKNAEGDAAAGWYMIGYREGHKRRKADMLLQVEQCQQEEVGARDALSEAFENLKKYEHVAEQAKVLAAKKLGAFESAQLDELSIRRAAVGGR
ncbi:flagellar export protein FliJ [Caulobacter segnis]|jgi:flagellar FliJ protein|uniref:flagellar export protein FliJ n=1 Tax=Caulobacter segnis TaxID=88688 RepID=UPI001CBEEF00|nr:flagellar export protein FliJ [Caulobacter segnis]UAL09802.1 flagellar export protein FliJ [Caulobacter segnis]